VNVLAIDSSTDRLTIAVARADGRITTRSAIGARRHASLLGPAVLAALGELELSLGDLGRILLADGPGSFTGLRVGAAWVKGVASVLGTPVATASTLMVRAFQARPPAPGQTRSVLGVGSALRGELYVAGYRLGIDRVDEAFAPRVSGPGGLLPAGFEPAWIVGDVPAEAVAAWGNEQTVRRLAAPDGWPDAQDLLALGTARGGTVVRTDLPNWEPVYGRPAEAQARWEREHGRPLVDSASRG
jgi:tRNA threonylcarbamoyladenosine biosynthesis protein TsaB